MKILFSQPANLYYAWQTELLLQNLLELGFCLNDVEVVCTGRRNKEWNALAHKYAARFFFYESTANSSYPSIGRPNAIKQHFRFYPELSKETILYIDCDVLFLQSPATFLMPLLDDDVFYLSDTKWYTGYCYLKSKREHVREGADYDTDEILTPLCDKIGISLDTVKANDDNSGGAQYLLKNVDWKFWESVEKDCTTIYEYFHYQFSNSINRKYFANENAGFQSFALGDMLAVLWNIWKLGKETRISKEMDFAWPGNGIQDKERLHILHNAGVTNDKDSLFYKGKYMNKLPYFDNYEDIKRDRMTWIYTEKLIQLKDITCLKNVA